MLLTLVVSLLETVIKLHFDIIKPGGFLVINIADILCFKDESMPRIQADAINRKRCSISRDDVINAMKQNPNYNRYQLAKLLGAVSKQLIAGLMEIILEVEKHLLLQNLVTVILYNQKI